MAYKRKRSFKKKRVFKKYAKKTTRVSPRVKSYVKREIARQTENKIQNNSIGSTGIFTYIYEPQFRFLNCLVSQGTGQGDRVGNQVRVRKATLRLNIWCSNAVVNSTISKYFDIYIVKNKKSNISVSAGESSQFLQFGNSSTAYDGDALDGLRTINRDVFIPCYHKRIKMVNSSDITNQSGTGGSTAVTLRIDCTKYLKKVQKFNDTTAAPTNDNLFLAIGAAFVDLPATAHDPQLVGYYTSEFEYVYEDA